MGQEFQGAALRLATAGGMERVTDAALPIESGVPHSKGPRQVRHPTNILEDSRKNSVPSWRSTSIKKIPMRDVASGYSLFLGNSPQKLGMD